MKRAILLIVLAVFAASAAAQSPSVSPTPAVKEANPADVSSIDAIMKAVYDVISGDAGVKRDWDRFRSLFLKDARMIPTGKNPQTGMNVARFWSPEDYVTRSGPFLEREGFHEREIARKVDQFGNVVQVFSSYHAFKKKDDKEPFMRGINSFQLFYDGKRWWVVSIFWQQESPETPIPTQYLK